MIIETETHILDLRSPRWVSAGTTHYWSSMGGVPEGELNDEALGSIQDNWAAIWSDSGGLVLASDLVRSHPLFYASVNGRWVVSDEIAALREHRVDWTRDEEAVRAFRLTGFTLNETTLIRRVRSVEAASIVRLGFGEDRADIGFWQIPEYAHPGIRESGQFARRYATALDVEFRALIQRSQGRQLVVPLSGGLDSRLVATWLRKLGAPNVLAFTYGKNGSPEVAVAREVADALRIPIVCVPLATEAVRASWFDRVTDDFRAATWKGSTLPHVQDWYALSWMKERGLVADDAVVVPGHTAVGAMHNESILEREASGADVALVLAEHHTLDEAKRHTLMDVPEFRRAVDRTFEQVPGSDRRAQTVIEWFNFRERQAKYINNSMSSYEYFGWDWALPLYWPDALRVWFSGSEELTATRDWYREFVDAQFAEVAGRKSTYFAPPAESMRIPFRRQLVEAARRSGINRVLSRLWELKTELDHPEALDGFVNTHSRLRLFSQLVSKHSLRGIWAASFLSNEWGSPEQQLVPATVRDVSSRPSTVRPRVLLISYSDIKRDARLLKQINLLSRNYDVTVCGHGSPFKTDAELLLFGCAESRGWDRVRALLLHSRLFGLAHRLEADNLRARRVLRGRSFDAVIANDIEPVGLALELYGSDHVHADLHEYYPGLQDEDPAWVTLRQPYYRWMLGRHVASARSVTTVSRRISARYMDEFGFEAGVVENALPDSRLHPSPVAQPIRLVHSGASLPNRSIEIIMRAAAATRTEVSLDLFLTGMGTKYYRHLSDLAQSLGPRIRLHEPVLPSEIVPTLNQYDVGVHILPATATNNALALPNKFFDYVQARLALVVGPTESMARRVREFDLGTVTEDFTEASLVHALDSLTIDGVRAWKTNAVEAGRLLDVSPMLAEWENAIAAIISRDPS